MTDAEKRFNLKLEKRRIMSKLMLWGGLGCLIMLVLIVVMVYIFIDRIVELLQ